ncbi:MAG TPA: hypothetical protein VN442_07430 [Bryobacteraceae bacterium]|nr:hypothetical protein [Bryobacteraceae bacterium]
MNRRPNLTTAVYLLLVFLSGALVGAFGYRLYMVNTVMSDKGPPRTPEEFRRRYVQELTARLHLSEDQVQKLQHIVENTGQRIREVHERSKPDMKAIEVSQYEQIRAMLTEDQRAEYEKMRAEREKRRQQKKLEGSRTPGR